MRGSQEAAESLARSGSQYVLLDLFQHPQVVGVHERQTAQEIIQATGGAIDAFVAGVGTGGTITGVGRCLKRINPAVQVVAVEPASSPVLSGGQPGRHMIPGIGADFVPPLLDRAIIDSVVKVTDGEASEMTLRLTREEGLLVGISSGANVVVAVQVARSLGAGKTVVTILPDTGERYLEFPA
jgi:cysteine synthase A